MSRVPFVHLSFHGARFEGASLPLEVLPELAAYKELVLAVAKELYLAENAQRQRLPKGFEASFQLVLAGVRNGSAVPDVLRVSSGGPTLFPDLDTPDFFAQSRDVVQRAIAAAAKGEPIPEPITDEVLVRFNALGRSLLDSERIDLGKPDSTERTSYTRKVRERLLRRSGRAYDDTVDLLGVVRAADKDDNGFTLRLEGGRKVVVSTSPLFFPRALKALGADSVVRVRGTGRYSPQGVLQSVPAVTDVSLAEEGSEGRIGCETPIVDQLAALRVLEEGWLDGDGGAYDPEELRWIEALLGGLVSALSLPTPYIYPTPEGTVRLEWPTATREIIATIDARSRTAELLAVNLDRDEADEEAHIPLGPGGESKLGKWLSDMLREVNS